jgi:hypothetical protein
MNLDALITRWGGWTEEYHFYNDTVTLRYDPKEHVYYLVTGDELKRLDGVTSICHIVDKSEILIPWACKMMAGKLFATSPVMTLPTGERVVRQMPWSEYESLVIAAKSAHRDKLEDAGEVGHTAHAWIEAHIKREIAGDLVGSHLSPMPTDERASNCCRAALSWMQRHNVRWFCTERKIYSRTYQYAGTMDGTALVDSCDDPQCCPHAFKDRLSVIDWKTSNGLYVEYLLQTSSYMQATNEQELFEKGSDARLATDRWLIRLGKDDGEFETWHCPVETFVEDFNGFLHALNLSRTIEALNARVKARAQMIRAVEKAKRSAEREAALKIKCSYADKYKGTRHPNCNGGNPCETCLKKYGHTQAAKAAAKAITGVVPSLPLLSNS